MKTSIVRSASVALAAAVAVIFVAGAFSYPPEIVSSFRLSGAAPPNPRGIHFYSNSAFVISYTAPGVNFLYEFSGQGSFISSVRLPGVRNRGASAGYRSAYVCLRDLGTEIWAYVVDLGPLMAVEPASLGRIKALYR